ncbi:hypothetical protein [Streptomyces lateritius]|uniref:hypothetical protein n=1 Tax=Streptomyces lateritius TaxID=67313 RepID=UPI001C8B54C8|nr:hypothetical protein [Streptomyces lateritius]MBX9425463.1 hypothetical protein [Streptomyces lateritius]
MTHFPACTRCAHDLRDDELGRRLCGRCEDRAAQQLAAIQGPRGLYAQLANHLERGGSSGGPAVSGSKAAPAPLRVDVLSLQCAGGPVLGPLEGWVRVWEDARHAELNEGGGLQERVDHACRTLRYNLRWAAEEFDAADEFAAELHTIHRTLTGITAGEKPPRHVTVTCPCQQPLRITLDVQALTCPGCRTEYGHGEILRLPLAERRAAA